MTNLQIIGNKVCTTTPVLEFCVVSTPTGWALDYKKVFFAWKNTDEIVRHPMSWGKDFGYDAVRRDAENVILTIARQLIGCQV